MADGQIILHHGGGVEWKDALCWEDLRRDYGEPRMVALGYIGLRLYSVAFVDRGPTRRIISLREAKRAKRMGRPPLETPKIPVTIRYDQDVDLFGDPSAQAAAFRHTRKPAGQPRHTRFFALRPSVEDARRIHVSAEKLLSFNGVSGKRADPDRLHIILDLEWGTRRTPR